MTGGLAAGEANEKAFDALVEAMRDGMAMAMVGAGSSARVGYPVWNALLDRMAAAIVRNNPLAKSMIDALASETDALWKAEEYRRMLGDDVYQELIRTTFGPEDAPYDELHKDLVSLPFRHVLTTNYDAVLEQAHVAAFKTRPVAFAWNETANMRELIQRIGDESYGRRYVYLHGRFDEPEETILTERDYTSRFIQSSDTLLKLFALLATQRVVSLGFSLSDVDVMGVFRQVRTQMGGGDPRHFALLAGEASDDTGVVRRRLQGKFGIEPIFYAWTQDHGNLALLVEEMRLRLRPTLPSLPPPASAAGIGGSQPLPPTAGYDPLCYVERPELERQMGAGLINPGTPIVLLGPARFGKTALLRHQLDAACREDHEKGLQSRAVLVELDTFAQDTTYSLEDFLYELSCHVVNGVDGDNKWIDEAWEGSGTPLTHMEALMRKHVLNTVTGRLILAIESADQLQRYSFSNTILGLLRSWAQNSSKTPWNRLRIVIAVSTEPTSFKEEIHRSAFFNAAMLVRLPDFTLEEVESLRDRYGLAWTSSDCQTLIDLVGGHPYLLRTAMFDSAQNHTPLPQILANAEAPLSIFEHFLTRVRQQLAPDLLAALCRVIQSEGAHIDRDVEDRLRGSGLLRGSSGHYRLRYALYERYFKGLCTSNP